MHRQRSLTSRLAGKDGLRALGHDAVLPAVAVRGGREPVLVVDQVHLRANNAVAEAAETDVSRRNLHPTSRRRRGARVVAGRIP